MKGRYFGFILLIFLLLFSCCACARQASTAEKACAISAAEDTVLGVRTLPDADIKALKDDKKIIAADEMGITLYYDGAEIPSADSRKTYYLTVDGYSDGWSGGCLTADIDCSLAFSETDTNTPLAELMKDGVSLTLYAYTDTVYTKLNIIFTTLPIVSVDTGGVQVGDEDVKCAFSVFEPRSGDKAAKLTASRAAIRIRGATSATMPKTGLRVSLYEDGSSDTRKISLLGMRCDDDWILYPSYSDEAKIRDAVGWYLWNKIGAYSADESEGTVALRYTEMILNGEYYGLYVLMERFDQKTLGLDTGDALFYASSWDIPKAAVLRRQSPRSVLCDGVEKKYPDPSNTDDGSWEAFADFIGVTYESEGSDFTKTIGKYANVSNMLDYWLFLQVVMGEDNSWKNTFYAFKDGLFYAYPWDLDITMGLTWKEDAKNFLIENPQVTSAIYDFQCGRRLIKYCPGAAAYVKKRWNELFDAGILTYEGIMTVARSYWDELQNSGAYKRNIERWPDTSYVDNLDYFDKIIKRRVKFLNNYINTLTDAG